MKLINVSLLLEHTAKSLYAQANKQSHSLIWANSTSVSSKQKASRTRTWLGMPSSLSRRCWCWERRWPALPAPPTRRTPPHRPSTGSSRCRWSRNCRHKRRCNNRRQNFRSRWRKSEPQSFKPTLLDLFQTKSLTQWKSYSLKIIHLPF